MKQGDIVPPIEEFKKWVRDNGITNETEFNRIWKSKLPPNYPKDPRSYYKKIGTWKGWSDFVGKKSPYLTNAPTYAEFQKWVQDHGIKTQTEFRGIWKSKLPPNYPKDPDNFYKKQGTWKGWNHLFGTKSRSLDNPPPIEEFKKWIRDHGIKTETEFKKQQNKLPNNFPKDPASYYRRKGTWKSWPDFCGVPSPFLDGVAPPIEEYQKWVQDNGINTQNKFKRLDKSKLPPNYPREPEYYYKKIGTWKSWGDFCGTGVIAPTIIAENYLSFKEAKKVYQKLGKKYGLKNRTEWEEFAKTHKKLLDDLRIPAYPVQTYTKAKVWGKMKK